ncbi:tetratricopeptide repeat-containing sulfotransferase family protein [Steroidobacter sp.]|uniref:tetratricopeptide repeat-containing sulfotransferase family protein n=1 Tax=Steroidobacter sp. TaxID=1978227 RepID=UPI001A4D8EAE|nr:tetratricopeptide repeat-containing sulfotransferase family protein [Steroidobacter sp.]MBL8266796.1 sulfotransferase [Steroidobacter sp.]
MSHDLRATFIRAEADARVEAAFARHKQGDIPFAYEVYKEVIAAFPEHSRALHYLGLIAQQTGHPSEAVRLLQRSIALDPSDARAHNHLGQMWVRLKNKPAALDCFEKAVQADATHADSINSLANALLVRDPVRAIELYRRVLELDPQSANAAYNLANALNEQRDSDAALVLYQRALEIDPQHVRAHRNVAVLMEQKGRFEQAAGHYQSALEINPRHAGALANLISLRFYEPTLENIHRAQQLLTDASVGDEERIKLNSGLGKYHDREGRYAQAFEHFLAAKRIVGERGAGFDVRRIVDQVDRTIDAFSPTFFQRAPRHGSDSARPIFIVGMPRSGTTLTEQILASHKSVYGAGELQDLPRILKGLRPGYPANIDTLDESQLAALAEEYLRSLQAQAGEALRITDKLPVNFMHLGMIATLFPRARIVHCRRDPMDVGLSCLIEQFDMENDFSTRLDFFGQYFLQYDRLMAHWRATLPLPMFELRYEQLVADSSTQVHALVDYCGLEWDEACLKFQQADRAVRTPSRWQVRQPIYQRSVGRWRNYAEQMEPLRRLLSESGYEY